MKKILCLAFVLFASVSVFAQEKTINQTEFESVNKNSLRLLAGKPRRIIRTQQSTVEVIPEKSVSSNAKMPPSNILVKSVTEIVPSVGFRSVYEFDSASLKTRKEKIRIAGKTYTRDGDGEWTEASAPQVVSRSRNSLKNVEDKSEYKIVGNEKLDNQNANVYARIRTGKIINSSGNNEGISTSTTKYWYGEDGRLLKVESRREISNGKTVSKFNSTILIELDPNIKIEPPR